MAIIQRFSTIRRGGIIFTGNTAGLAPVNASGRRYGTRHGVGRIFGKCDTCAHLQSVVAVVGHQPCRLDACGGLRGLLAAASQSDSVVRSVGGLVGRGQRGHLRRGVSHAGFAAYQRKTFRVGAGGRRGNRRRQPAFRRERRRTADAFGPQQSGGQLFRVADQQFVGTARHERHFRHAQRKRRAACGDGSGACRRVCDVPGRRRHNNTIKRF